MLVEDGEHHYDGKMGLLTSSSFLNYSDNCTGLHEIEIIQNYAHIQNKSCQADNVSIG